MEKLPPTTERKKPKGHAPKGSKNPKKKTYAPRLAKVQEDVPIENIPPPEPRIKRDGPTRHITVTRMNMGDWVEYTVVDVTNATVPAPGDHFDGKQLDAMAKDGWLYTVQKL